MDKYDNRQSGRTTKAIMAACRWAAENAATATFVLHSGAIMPYIGGVIRRVDPNGHYENETKTYHLSDGGKVQFTTMKNRAVRMDILSINHVAPDSVFFDHEAIRVAHNRILQEFHRYG